MWDLPGPGLEPVSPALAGEFLTTVPPGKPPNHTFNHLDLIDIFRKLHPISEHAFFSCACSTFTKTNYLMDHQTSLNKFKRTAGIPRKTKEEILLSMFFDHSRIKLEINNNNRGKITPNIWKLNKIFLSNLWIKEVTGKNRKYFGLRENENHNMSKFLVCNLKLYLKGDAYL